ncbi:MAG: DUF928 domain-containing protein [Cyanothece sp. SIO2G6]|nr:DUF928 domain-containing protein [Cyanothece sp. SIO2G6]
MMRRLSPNQQWVVGMGIIVGVFVWGSPVLDRPVDSTIPERSSFRASPQSAEHTSNTFLNATTLDATTLDATTLDATTLDATTLDATTIKLNNQHNSTQNSTHNERVLYTPPPDAGTPASTGGTGSRGGCLHIPDRPPLAALVGQPHLMLTTSDRPVFWIYVPYTAAEAPSGIFSLQQGDDAVYEATFSLSSTPGVLGIRLPESAPPLAVGEEYDWFIDINCVAAIGDGTMLSDTPGSLYGLVQRVEMSDDLANDLNQAQTGLEVVAAYGQHHIWYDWLTELAQLRLGAMAQRHSGESIANPDLYNPELTTIWATVLADEQTVLLAPWANEPLVGETVVMEWHSNTVVKSISSNSKIE